MLSSAGLSLRRWASGCQRGRRTVATVISGNKTSQMVRERLKKDVEKMKKEAPGFRPGLVVLQVGDRDDSNLYISMKLKAAAEIGIDANHIRLPRSATEDEVLKAIVSVNENPAVHGLIVQLPLDSDHKIDTEAVTDAVSPLKDVDGLTSINAGKLSRGDLGQCFIPCTPNGCMELIRQTGVEVAGKNVVVIGRSKIVGAPMHDLLLWSHGTVTTCHSKTQDLAAEVGRADILVVGAGKAEMVKGDWVKEGAVVIDCGINHIPDDSKPSGQRVVGDVHYPSAKERAGFITPVPGGVGPMTVAMLMENTVQSAWRFLKRHQSGKWNLSSTSVNPQTPQPSDGAIAHSCTPKAVGRLVREVGLFSGEAVPYGPFRAKVSTEARKRLKLQRDGRYVVVTGVARQGAGSRIVSIGLTDALAAHLHVNSMGCLTHRTGGVFGGGYSQVFPMDEVSAMLDSDFYAVTMASRLIDTALRERLEPSTEHTLEKQLSSDILSVLAVSQSQQDLSNRLAKLVVATGPDNTPVTTNDLGISRVLAALLRDTLKPTLKQTLEGSPVFVHTNPLSGSSRCDSPVMADHIALKLVGPEGIVVTETGSIDNFVHMKCRRAGLQPDVVVMVATVAGIRKLGGKAKLKKKIWLPDYRISPKFDSKALQEGCRRLNTLIQRATLFGLPVVFAVNVFSSDTTEDIELLCSQAELGGAVEAVPCSSWSLGGAGAVQLGRAVQRATQSKHKVNFLYDMEMSIEEKIRSVAHSMYGAAEVKLLPQAQRKVALFTQQGLSGLPVSLSPSQHDVPVREGLLTIQDLRANTGARFLSALYDTSPPSTLTLTQTPPPCLYDIDLYPENQ